MSTHRATDGRRVLRLADEHRRADVLLGQVLPEPIAPERLVRRAARLGIGIEVLKSALDRVDVQVDPHGRLRLPEEKARLA